MALYIVPSVIAFRRRHPNRLLILTINLVLGGTLIGWAVALYLATRSAPAARSRPV
ncbi:superinfection immunity protein [Streptomyces griseocarneus]|uniref:superinfection immunity protein n=1 Tax=Streptomyces griseocarneus TaxID=51201 RepID=UPI001F61E920|nr:superinfection immunity protein [Streptomyces griseocarneus]